MTDQLRCRRHRRRSRRLSGGHSRGAEQAVGRLHRRVEEPRRQPRLRRHLPECRLHSVQGAAGILRAVAPRAARVRGARHQARRRRARPRGHAEAQGQHRQAEHRGHPGAVQARPGVTPLQGHGKLLPGRKVEFTAHEGETKVLQAKHVVLASGSEPMALKSAPFDGDAHRRFLGRARVRRRAEAAGRDRRRRHRAGARQRLAAARRRGRRAGGARAVPADGGRPGGQGSAQALQEARPGHPPRREGHRRAGEQGAGRAWRSPTPRASRPSRSTR